MKNMNRWLIVMVIIGIISTTAQGAEEATPEWARKEYLYKLEGLKRGTISRRMQAINAKKDLQKGKIWGEGESGFNALKEEQNKLPEVLADLIQGFVSSRWTDKKVTINSEVFRGSDGKVNSVAISPDSSFIVTGSWDKIARIWNTDGRPLLNVDNKQIAIRGHTDSVNSVAISADSKLIVTGSQDKTARIWNKDGTPLLNKRGNQIVLAGHTDGVSSVAISPDNKFVVTGSDDTTARIWNAQTGELLNALKGYNRIYSVAISADGGFIVTTDGTVEMWDRNGNHLNVFLKSYDKSVNSVAISPDNNFIVTGSYAGTVEVFNARTGDLLKKIVCYDQPVTSVAISSDSSFIVTCPRYGSAKIWNRSTGKLLHTLGDSNLGGSVAISSDSRFIVTGSSGGRESRIWRLE